MHISFDLDDTLIPGSRLFETEKRMWLPRIFGVERIRLGTISLFKELRRQGHHIHIYTTSYRPVSKIRWMFFLYGIPVDRIVNQDVHDRQVNEFRGRTSKYPPAFGFDIHVDDLVGVKMEGDKFGFHTIIVDTGNKNWVEDFLEKLSLRSVNLL